MTSFSPKALPVAGQGRGERAIMLARTIDLTPVRVHVGARFPAMADRLHALFQKDLTETLDGIGWFGASGDDFYVVVLGSTTQRRADEVLGELVRRLRGHLGALKVDTTGLFIPVNAMHFDHRGRPRLDAIQSLDAENESQPVTPVDLPPAQAKGRYAFEPVWNVRQGVVSAFRTVRLAAAEDCAAPAEDAAPGLRDSVTLRHAMSEWTKLPGTAVCLVIVPVSFETLATSLTRGEYLRTCELIPPALRRLLIFEIEQIPKGVMAERLIDVSRYLKSYCRSFTCRVAMDFDEFASVQRGGFSVVSCHVHGMANEHAVLQGMDRFVEGAERQKLQTCIYGIQSVSLTTAALAAGFVYIGGEAVSSLGEAPRGLFKFETADVYRDLPRVDAPT